MKTLYLFPCNGNSREAVSVIEACNRFQPTWVIKGFLDDDKGKHGQTVAGYQVLGTFEHILEQSDCFLLAVPGRPETLSQRTKLLEKISQALPPEKLATIIHPSADIGVESKVGHNSLIMNNVVLTTAVTLTNNVIILPNSVISHDSTVRNGTIIGSNVSISGGVNIGPNCYIGTGSKILQEVDIGAGSIVGIGSVVLEDVPPNSVYAGNPARFIRGA